MNLSLRHLALLTIPGLLVLAGIAYPDDPPPPTDPQVLARGPVHEALARPAETPAATPIIAKEPPAAIKEIPPAQKPDMPGVEWVPGYWSYDDEKKDYIWVSGTWRVPPPGRQWIPGTWNKVNGGWQWQHGFWGPTDPGGVQPFASVPPASLEAGASSPPPTADSFYTPGQWVFQNDEWQWQPGSWSANSNDMVYVPPEYLPNQNGSMYVPGYWDYPLQNRGMLFAPVAFNGSPWLGNPGWSYQPGYSVGLNGLLGSLFIRPNLGSYYFGNYFGNGYRGYGYQPWTAFGRRGYDPLLNYYAWANRGTRGWNGNLAGLYTSRLNGTLPAPAISLAQQLRPAPNINANLISLHTANFSRNLSVNPVNSLRTVHPLSQAGQLRLINATGSQLWRPNFGTRQSFSRPVAPVVHAHHQVQTNNSGLRLPSLPGNPVSLPGNPVSLPGGSPIRTLPQARIANMPRVQMNRVMPNTVHRVAPQMHVAPRVQTFQPAQTFRAAPAMHGHVGGGRIGGGHVGGHGGGHRR